MWWFCGRSATPSTTMHRSTIDFLLFLVCYFCLVELASVESGRTAIYTSRQQHQQHVWMGVTSTEAHSAVPHRPYRPTASLRDIQPWAIIDALFQLAYETIQCLQAPGLYRLYYYVTVPYQMNCSWRDLAFSHKLSRKAYFFFLSFFAYCRFLMRHVIRNLTL